MASPLSRDPYKTFRFKVKWDSKFVAGVNSVSALTQTTEPIEFRAGGDPLAMKTTPGQTNFEPITLERGLTVDTEFHDWAVKLDPNDAANGEYEDDFRKDVTIILCDENGNEGVSFLLINCWVSKYNAMPDLDSGDNAIAIESLTLEHEGWAESDWNTKPGDPAKSMGGAGRDSTIYEKTTATT